MLNTFLFVVILIAVLSYPIYRMGTLLWERYFLTPEERWRRKYDKRMKNFFKQI